jgi:hypothetical protein
MPEQKCPLCKQVAKYKGVHFGRNKYFRCPNCKDFVIALSIEENVAGLKQEIREHFSRQSSALKSDSVLLIYATEPVAETSELKGEEQPKDKWIEYRP